MNTNKQKSDFLPEIRFGKIGILKIHQISDDELTKLEHGSGQSLFLNLGIGIFSVAVSFFISLLTTNISSDRLFYTFVIVTALGFLASIVLIILWWCTHRPIRKLVQEIRVRMPPEGEAQ